MIYGHLEAQNQLKEPAPVTIIHGPEHVGKFTLALELVTQESVLSFDGLSASITERINRLASYEHDYPIAVVGCLDGASGSAWNSLLRILEDPPKRFTFIFTASERIPLSIQSRARVVRVGTLTDQDLITIFQEKFGYSVEEAVQIVPFSNGTTRTAAKLRHYDPEERGRITNFLKAARVGQLATAATYLDRLNEDAAELLVDLLVMSICTDKPPLEVTPSQAFSMLKILALPASSKNKLRTAMGLVVPHAVYG